MPDNKKAATAASIAVAGLIVAAGATAAITANAETSTATNGSGYGAPAGYGTAAGYGQQGQQGQRGGQQDAAASAAETSSVTAAIKAKDSSVTVQRVSKDADGSFDAFGTKAGQPVMFEVSKDLKTITQNTNARGGQGHGGQHGTPASTTETAQVKAAVKAKDSTITVEGVAKNSDGSFEAFGTKAGARVHVTVSKDLKTVTVDTAGPRGGQQTDARGATGQQPTGTPSAPSGSSSQPA